MDAAWIVTGVAIVAALFAMWCAWKASRNADDSAELAKRAQHAEHEAQLAAGRSRAAARLAQRQRELVEFLRPLEVHDASDEEIRSWERELRNHGIQPDGRQSLRDTVLKPRPDQADTVPTEPKDTD